MASTLFPQDIPSNSILGINYSGMHDSALAIVSPEGRPLFALSLERVSRVKQDGRFPSQLLEQMPWDKIDSVALSVESEYLAKDSLDSRFHPKERINKTSGDRSHGDEFFALIEQIDKPIRFFPHHLCHAASAFWVSEFTNALCLVYDGGMANEDWFGAVYQADRSQGIQPLDQFAAHHSANVAYLYSTVTALLGFSPLKHEGKITGLAAHGQHNPECITALENWLASPEVVDGISYWQHMYSCDQVPVLKTHQANIQALRQQLNQFSDKDLAYAVQLIAEQHIVEILKALREAGFSEKHICLSGGLFANVKINQRVSEFGFESVFVSPPMSDDGTALGAALQLASENPDFKPQPLSHVYLGNGSSEQQIDELLKQQGIAVTDTQGQDDAEVLAQLLADEKIVAVFQGACEFGPRALGNRSILASASDADINRRLNQRLQRTEFMPFAPMCLMEDCHSLFDHMQGLEHTAQFMTITADCKPIMAERCPAVVHCDNTARPQLVTAEQQPLIHQVISRYKAKTGNPAIVNTSFNVHEEPIIGSAEDALKGFFESGLDYLYLQGKLIKLSDNLALQADYLDSKIRRQAKALKQQGRQLDSQVQQHHSDIATQQRELEAKSTELQEANRREHELKTTLSKANLLAQQQTEKANSYEQQLMAIYNSISWKLTAPLRKLKKTSSDSKA